MTQISRFHPLSQEHNFVPSHISLVHLMGVCGTGMAGLAGALKELGYQVRGSDRSAYPPMSTFLHELGIPILMGFKAQNLAPRPDLVVIGNVVSRDNPEVQRLARLKIPFVSFPQALNHFVMQETKRIVIAGTHGKTTTSSLMAWLLQTAGLGPGFMIGGIPNNFMKGFQLGKGHYFVIEGDEYDTAFFDKGPKFFHYHPDTLILTSIEYDHADIYNSLEQIVANFQKLVGLVPPKGYIIANADDQIVSNVIRSAKCTVITYGACADADWRLEQVETRKGLSLAKIRSPQGTQLSISISLYGKHNLANLTATVALGAIMGLSEASILKAAETFRGVKRRQELLGEARGILVLDDFAHHPTAVRETISAVKEAFPQRRLVAVFEPRSNSSRRNVFQEQYARSFDAADLIMIPEPRMLESISPDQRFSSMRLVQDLKRQGKPAYCVPDSEALLPLLLEKTRSRDVVLFMSNGDMDGLPGRFLESLQPRPADST
ncbi:MAG TPA: UDP-N-acetylmuramate--L-alanine ligase [Desulfobacterales bacterium]|nr:UDP-N-acetylmuramate--L-alanine ligase [Desulfobacterales bacterium]